MKSGAERWLSGRKRSPAKGVWGKPHRGFESLSLRHLHPLLPYFLITDEE